MLHFSNFNRMDNTTVTIKTNFPLYISMTTIPSRLNNTIKIIRNVLDKVSGYEKIILNLPLSYKNHANAVLPKELNDLTRDSRFLLNKINEDLGPITKLIPSLQLIPRNCILIMCDDDCYHHEAFKIIAENQDKNIKKSFTFWKYNYDSTVVPQGVDMISFWRPNLDGFEEWWESTRKSKYCFYVDDLLIGRWLQIKGIPVEKLDRKWKWPWIANCLPKKTGDRGLFGQKGKFERKKSMRECMKFLL